MYGTRVMNVINLIRRVEIVEQARFVERVRNPEQSILIFVFVQ